jgi:hypothetical protein
MSLFARFVHWIKGYSANHEERAFFMVFCRRTTSQDAENLTKHESNNGNWMVAIRSVLSEGLTCNLQYWREDRAEFDATYRQICESFRVIREK